MIHPLELVHTRFSAGGASRFAYSVDAIISVRRDHSLIQHELG